MNRLRKLSGVLLFVGLIVTCSSAFTAFFPLWLGSVVLWLAGLILFFDIDRLQKKIIIAISLLALISWLIAWQTGYMGSFVELLSVNQKMIIMLIGVQFLQLVALPSNGANENLPTGEKAFIKTYFGVHLFGSVINLSSILLVADRLYEQMNLSRNQLKLLTRAFSSAANWSPFFAAFAAAMVFASNASLIILMPFGLAISGIGFLLTWLEVRKDKTDLLRNFVGYPIHFNALWLPIVLALLVFISHYLLPTINVLILIALCSLLISVLVLIMRQGLPRAVLGFQYHVHTKLPRMKNELLLFLIAGVLGSGVAAAFDSLSIGVPIVSYNGYTASVILFFMLLLAMVGVHPVISIAVIGHWIASVQPDHTLLAMMFLMAWSIGISTSPISGINLALQGRYKASGWTTFVWNSMYAVKMYAVACLVLMLSGYILKI